MNLTKVFCCTSQPEGQLYRTLNRYLGRFAFLTANFGAGAAVSRRGEVLDRAAILGITIEALVLDGLMWQ